MDHTVVHFDIPAKGIPKLRKFYSDLFGWKIEKVDPGMGMEYWIIETVPQDKQGRPLRPGINGGMGAKQNEDYKPHNTISVESVDDYSKKIEKLGGKVLPKAEIPGIGWYALATDPEGNQFGILQPMEMNSNHEP